MTYVGTSCGQLRYVIRQRETVTRLSSFPYPPAFPATKNPRTARGKRANLK